ncbi:nitrilase-related carbon-nitrogen hydrolase [Candidatus Altiarchaeota archaeon]
MRVGFLQTNPMFMDVEGNVENVVEKLGEADADLFVLPEMFNTGYNFKDREKLEELSEDIPSGYTTQRLIEVSREGGMTIVAGLPEKGKDGNLYNSAVLVDGDKVSLYRKTHLFHEEKNMFAPGDTGFGVFDVSGVKIGVMVCYDWVFPEAARTLALMGAEIIVHPANLILPYCPEAMRTRSLENRVFSITANRIGTEEELTFIGSSQIVDPKGNILYRAGSKDEEIKILEINPEEARDKQLTPLNSVFEDRRREMYKL